MEDFQPKRSKGEEPMESLWKGIEDDCTPIDWSTSTSVQISESTARAIWDLNNINSENDFEAMASNDVVECIVGFDENIHLRFYFGKIEIPASDDYGGVFTYLSLCVAVLPSGEATGTIGESNSLVLTVTVDQLTESCVFDDNILPETSVTISSEEAYRGVVVDKHFLNYFCNPVPPEGLKFGITVSMKIQPLPKIETKEEVPAELVSILLENWDLVGSADEPKEKATKIRAKDGVELDANNFILAAQSQMLLKQLHGITEDEQWFDTRDFIRDILEWLDLGEMKELTGSWVMEKVETVNTAKEVIDFKTQLEEEASRISFGYYYSHTRKSKGFDMRTEMMKKRTLRRLVEFIREFVELLRWVAPIE